MPSFTISFTYRTKILVWPPASPASPAVTRIRTYASAGGKGRKCTQALGGGGGGKGRKCTQALGGGGGGVKGGNVHKHREWKGSPLVLA